ncbi:MAG: hypothetical protein ACP5T3_00335 [Candidatus Micrarchaeia archaeon]
MRGKKFIIIGAALVVVVLLLVFAIASMSAAALKKIQAAPAIKQAPMRAAISEVESSFFDYENGMQLVDYALANYSAINVTTANISLAVYAQNPIKRIYLVNTSRYSIDAFDGLAVYENLSRELSAFGLLINSSSFSYVPMQDLQHINNSIVIIASGLMPLPLLENQSISIFKLLDNGDTVIYVGRNFSKAIGTSGVIFVTPQNVTSELAAYGISTMPAYSVMNASEEAKLNSSFKQPTFFFSAGNRYGGISYINVHNGTIIAFSNYPNVAWPNASVQAYSLASSISADFWLDRLAYGIENVSNGTGAIGIYTNLQRIPMPNNTAEISALNSTYSLLRLGVGNASAFEYVLAPFRSKYVLHGTMSMPSVISDTQNVSIGINSSVSTQSQLHIDILDTNMSYVTSVSILHTFLGSVQIVLTHSFSLPTGTYIAILRNQYNENYTAALFSVPTLNITPVNLNFKNGTFEFDVYSGTFPVSAKAQVSFDKAYGEIVPISSGVMEYDLPKGTIISYGKQQFSIDVFGQRINYTTTYSKEIMHIPAFYIEVGVVLLAVLLLNLVLKPPNRDEYYIDVPTFLPEKREVIKTKPEDMLGVFEKVNYYYHWNFMPLTLEEFKNGIASYIRYNNVPVSITTQNAQLILDTLTKSGAIIEESGYYALAQWISISKHDIEYLVVFRALRDYCVEHAVLFTELNAEPSADMLITKKGRQAKVIIYSRKSGMRRFEIDANDNIFIVFVSNEALSEFSKKLYSAFTETAEVLKVAIQYGHVKLVSIEDLSGLIV